MGERVMRELLHSPLIRFFWWAGLSYALFRYFNVMPEDKSAIWAVLVGIFGAVEKITIELDGLKNRIEGSTPLSEEQIRRVEQEVRRRIEGRWPEE